MLGLEIAYLCTKFDHSSFSRSRDIIGAHQNLNSSHDLTTPFQWWFAIRGLALATINLSTKCEVSISTKKIWNGYKISKIGYFGVVKGHSKSMELAPFDRAHTSSYYRSIVTICPYLDRFWDIEKYWSKIADCNLLYLYLASPLGVTPLEFRRDLWNQKTRVPGLAYGVVCVILGLAILVQYRRVTDGRTDEREYEIAISK